MLAANGAGRWESGRGTRSPISAPHGRQALTNKTPQESKSTQSRPEQKQSCAPVGNGSVGVVEVNVRQAILVVRTKRRNGNRAAQITYVPNLAAKIWSVILREEVLISCTQVNRGANTKVDAKNGSGVNAAEGVNYRAGILVRTDSSRPAPERLSE